MDEDPTKDTHAEQNSNPAILETSIPQPMDMGEAANFWKEVIDGMADFELDVERSAKRQKDQRQDRRQKARQQQEQFWARFRNTPRYYELMRQRRDGAHAFRTYINRTRNAAANQGRTFQPPTFTEFAEQTDHPLLPKTRGSHQSPHLPAIPPQTPLSNYGEKVALQYCRRCGWKEAQMARPMLYPPLNRTTAPDGTDQWSPKEGYQVEMSHTSATCPKYKTESSYRCHKCACMGITAFHTISECADVPNPHNTANLHCILVDDQGEVFDPDNFIDHSKN